MVTAGLIGWNSLGMVPALAQSYTPQSLAIQNFETSLIPDAEAHNGWTPGDDYLYLLAQEKLLRHVESRLEHPFSDDARYLLTDAEYFGILLRSGSFHFQKGKYRGQINLRYRVDTDRLRNNYWYREKDNEVYRLYARLYNEYKAVMEQGAIFDKARSVSGRAVARVNTQLHKANSLYRALQAYERNDWSASLYHTNEYLHLAPGAYYMYNFRASNHIMRGEYSLAMRDINITLNQFEDYAHAYANRARIYTAQKQYQKAIQAYYDALFRDGLNPYYYNRRGALFKAVGDKKRAFIDFDKAVSLHQKEAHFYSNRGQSHYENQNMVEALNDFTQAVLLDRNTGFYRYQRGNVRLSMEDYGRAINDYSKAIALGERSGDLYFNRGLAHEAKKWFNRAYQDYSQAVAYEPSNSEFLSKRTAMADWQRKIGNPSQYRVVETLTVADNSTAETESSQVSPPSVQNEVSSSDSSRSSSSFSSSSSSGNNSNGLDNLKNLSPGELDAAIASMKKNEAGAVGLLMIGMIAMGMELASLNPEEKAKWDPYRGRVQAIVDKIKNEGIDKNKLADPNYDGRPLLKEVMVLLIELEKAGLIEDKKN